MKAPMIDWNSTHVQTNYLEERLLDQAQARTSYTPLFVGSFA